MNIEKKLYKIPQLHSKYLKLYLKAKVKLSKLERELNDLYRKKYHYYSFEYEERLESVKEIQFHILGDEEYSDVKQQLDNQDATVKTLEYAVKKTQQLTYDIKNIIEYTKYINGV
jgi:hypothetical protein